MRGIRFFSGKTRWFRSTTAPLTKPVQFKYAPKEPPGGFEPFNEEDSRRLEETFKQGSQECIIQQDGLFKVNFKDRYYTATYWESPTFRVLRGTWFVQGSKPTPLDEAVAEEIERRYQDGETTFKLKMGQEVKLSQEKDQITGTMTVADSWTDKIKSLQLTGSQKIVRGYPDDKAAKVGAEAKDRVVKKAKKAATKKRMEDNLPHPSAGGDSRRPVKHLVLAIHGIGQQLGLRYEFINFVKDTNMMRDLMGEVFSKDEHLRLAAASETNHGLQVLPVLWRHLLPKHTKNCDPKLRGLTAPQLMAKDNILADVALDYVMYTHEDYRKSMLEVTAGELNRVFKLFCENNPEFAQNPRVSLAGHSLGSVIVNELLRCEDTKLDFEVDKAFLLGSPVGCLQFLTGKPFSKDGASGKSMYNIFRPSDPIGSRIEPLVAPEAVKIKPKPLPANDKILSQLRDFTEELSSLGLSITTSANVLWKQIAPADFAPKQDLEEKPRQLEVDPKVSSEISKQLACFNRHGRLDFSIPESVDISLFLAIAGHTMYFDNYDLISFIMREILDVPFDRQPMVYEEPESDALASS